MVEFYYADDYLLCQQCSDPLCSECNSTYCFNCKPSRGVVRIGNACSCSNLYFFDTAIRDCCSCMTNCVSCKSSKSCVKCDDGYIYDEGKCQLNCSYVASLADIMCNYCQLSNCMRCTDRKCIECKGQFSLYLNSCLVECPYGYYSAVTAGIRACSKCNSICKSCTDVGINNCIDCVDGYAKSINREKCEKIVCKSNEYMSSSTACLVCHPKCASCIGASPHNCTLCNALYKPYRNANSTYTCLTCEEIQIGTYLDVVTGNCEGIANNKSSAEMA